VHRGQTVQFDSLNFHTVSFLRGGEDGRLPAFRRDEGPSGFAITEAAWQRSACGDPDQPACVLDEPDDQLSSGFPVWDLTWRVQIDRPVGTTITYFCNFHPGMKASIEVVDDAEPLPTQQAIDAEVEAQVALDTQEAIDHRAMLEAQRPHRREGGRTVWTVQVGASTPSGHVSILGYMPSHLVGVRPADAVEFVSSGPDGHHSVTFPTVLVGDNEISPNNRLTLAALHPACDFDDRTSGAPGIPGPYAPFTPLACPASLEFLPSPYVTNPHPAPGNLVATPATYHDSGLMWSEEAPEWARGRPAGSGDYFLHRFVAEFPTSGEFEYACTIHGADFMAGTIRVGGLDPASPQQRGAR
jgi:plastocyanin